MALAGEAGQFVRGGRAFRQGILPWRKGIGIHADSPAGLIVHPHRRTGGPEIKGGKHAARQQSCTSPMRRGLEASFAFRSLGLDKARYIKHALRFLTDVERSPPNGMTFLFCFDFAP
ncbi:hypothetical protein [Dyella terrae]|uniref:hypothetical protein n=1 Tax=Dyella terrae TaxID=522259 RepID=UPI001EFD16D2|nr:hypothetical protein [Dyella terrae]